MRAENTPSFVVEDATTQTNFSRSALAHPDYEKAVGKIQGELDRRASRIDSDESLDAGERHGQRQQTYEEAQDTLQRVTEAYERSLASDVENALDDLFKVEPMRRGSVREAYEMVYRATSGFDSGTMEGLKAAREELERYETRARRTGDESLKIAVLHIALERGIAEVRDPLLSEDKSRNNAWERYNRAAHLKEDFHDPKKRGFRKIAGGWGLKIPPPSYE